MVIVYVDERERNSRVPQILSSRGITTIFKMLDVGDYIISEKTGIERKTAEDFIKSLLDGRLFDQASRLQETFEKPIIIIEGNIFKADLGKMRRSSITGALVTLIIDMNIVVIQTRNEFETAEIIRQIALHDQQKKRVSTIVRPSKPRLSTVEEWQIYILQCFPNIGPKIALRILEELGSIHRFCNASLSELMRIEGLGEKKASEIYQIIHALYKDRKEKSTSKTIVEYMKNGNEDANDH